MATYRLSAGLPISRSRGQSVVASAAYRAGEKMADERYDKVHDYTRRRGVLHTEIMAPDNAPDWMCDRAQLWNAIERLERRKDAQLARNILLSLPHELTHEQRVELVRGFVREEFVSKGMIADIAVHAPDRSGDERNHHAHILLTFREIAGDGFGAKARAWNDRDQLRTWRRSWADHQNQTFERLGLDIRVDHRSLEDQGLDLEPEPKLGPVATEMERKGKRSNAGDAVREVRRRNRRRHELKLELAEISAELDAIIKGRDLEEEDAMANETADHDKAQAEQAAKNEQARQNLAQQTEQERQAGEATAQQAKLDKAGAEFAEAEAARRREAAAEYDRRLEARAKEHADRLVQQTEEMRAADQARADELKKEQENSKAYHLEQARIAQIAKQEAAQEAADVRDPQARYAQALGRHYNVADPYASLARAAMAEYASFMSDREKLTQQMAVTADPTQRKALEVRRQIEGLEYLAITGDRIAQQSIIISGRFDPETRKIDCPEAAKHRTRAAACRNEATKLREQLRDLQRERTRDASRAADVRERPEREPRPYRPRNRGKVNQNEAPSPTEALTPEQEIERRNRLLREQAGRASSPGRTPELDRER